MPQRSSAHLVPAALDKLFGSSTTKLDKNLLIICKITGAITLSGAALQTLARPFSPLIQNLIYTLFAISAFVFILSFCILGIRTAGKSHGKTGFMSQLWFMFSRVTLFVFLPAALLTLVMVIWAILTHQPVFNKQ